jgi:hypothetical protein
LPGLLIGGGVLLLAWVLPYRDPPFEICTLKRWAEIPCPFCGSTRSFAAAAKGDMGWAWSNSPLALLLFGVTALGVVWNAGGLLTQSLWLPGRWLKAPVLTGRRLFWILFAAVSANYTYRLMNGLY